MTPPKIAKSKNHSLYGLQNMRRHFAADIFPGIFTVCVAHGNFVIVNICSQGRESLEAWVSGLIGRAFYGNVPGLRASSGISNDHSG